MEIDNLLSKWKINITFKEILERWNEPWRFYHNQTHLFDLFFQIENYRETMLELDYEKLILTAIFHDIIYIPESKYNEKESSKFFLGLCTEINYDILHIAEMILDTQTHQYNSFLSRLFIMFDMDIINRDFDTLLKYEQDIYQEYKYLGSNYKEKRIEFLCKTARNHPNKDNLMKLIGWVEINY